MVAARGRLPDLPSLLPGLKPTAFDPGGYGAPGRIALTTHLDREGEETTGALELRGDEGVILELD